MLGTPTSTTQQTPCPVLVPPFLGSANISEISKEFVRSREAEIVKWRWGHIMLRDMPFLHTGASVQAGITQWSLCSTAVARQYESHIPTSLQ